MEEQSYIPYRNIADHIDIVPSDILIIASDVTKIAFQAKRMEGEFDIDAFIDSFTKRITMSGTLILPAYNFHLKSGQEFDLKRTLPATGALPLAAFKRADFIRTWHPLHSFLSWGQRSSELKSLRNISSFGPDSPFAKFYEWNAKMLFIGTNVAQAFTYTHFVEETEHVKYRHFKKRLIQYYEDGKFQGKKKFILYEKRAGWTMNLERLQDKLESGILDIMTLNNVHFSQLKIRDAHKIILGDIRGNKAESIAHFESKLFFRDLAKNFLHKFRVYRTTQDKINHGTGI